MSRRRTVGMLAELVKLKKHNVPKLTKVIFDCSDPLDDVARDKCKEVDIAWEVRGSRFGKPRSHSLLSSSETSWDFQD